MFMTLVLIFHIVVCLALILIILLQTGKGADIGAAFGGGSSQTVFGSTGATPFLSKITIAAAVAFMCTSIVLTYFSGRVGIATERSIVTEESRPETAPAQLPQSDGQKAAPAATPAPAPGATEGAPASPATPSPAGQPSEKPQ
jgi:preprotein translocase subunit SecG